MNASLKKLLAQAFVELVKAAIVGFVAGASGMSAAELDEQIRRAAPKGRSRSRSGPPVVFLQRVPKEGARS